MVIIKKSVISIILVVCIVFGLLVFPASATSVSFDAVFYEHSANLFDSGSVTTRSGTFNRSFNSTQETTEYKSNDYDQSAQRLEYGFFLTPVSGLATSGNYLFDSVLYSVAQLIGMDAMPSAAVEDVVVPAGADIRVNLSADLFVSKYPEVSYTSSGGISGAQGFIESPPGIYSVKILGHTLSDEYTYLKVLQADDTMLKSADSSDWSYSYDNGWQLGAREFKLSTVITTDVDIDEILVVVSCLNPCKFCDSAMPYAYAVRYWDWFSFSNEHNYQSDLYNYLSANLSDVLSILQQIEKNQDTQSDLISVFFDLVNVIQKYLLDVQSEHLTHIYESINDIYKTLLSTNVDLSLIRDFSNSIDDSLLQLRDELSDYFQQQFLVAEDIDEIKQHTSSMASNISSIRNYTSSIVTFLQDISDSIYSIAYDTSDINSALKSLIESQKVTTQQLNSIIDLLGKLDIQINQTIIEDGDGDDGGFSLLDLLGLIKKGLVSIVKSIWRGLTGVFDNVSNLWDAYSFNETQNNLTNDGVWEY